MKKLYLFLAFLCGAAGATAQTYDLQFVPVRNDGIAAGRYEVRLQIRKGSGPDFKVGSSNIRFNYNDQGLTPLTPDPLAAEHHFDDGLNHPTLGIPTYTDMTSTGTLNGLASVNIDLDVPNFGFPTISTAWVDIATFAFTIDDPLQSSQLVFRTSAPGNTVIFADNEFTLLTQGTFIPLDEPLDGAAPLPIDLVEFSAKNDRTQALLFWTTASEKQGSHFEVEHALDGAVFKKIGSVEAKGESSVATNYAFVHKSPTGGINYYRLKMIDTDGAFAYSETRVLEFAFDQAGVSVSPNPFGSFLEMSLSWEAHTEITVALFDAQGRQLQVLWHGPLSAERQTLRFEGLDQLEQGVYFLRVQSREGKVVTSVLINH